MPVNVFRDVYPAEDCSALREQRQRTNLKPRYCGRDVGDEPRTQQALPLWSSAALQLRQIWQPAGDSGLRETDKAVAGIEMLHCPGCRTMCPLFAPSHRADRSLMVETVCYGIARKHDEPCSHICQHFVPPQRRARPEEYRHWSLTFRSSRLIAHYASMRGWRSRNSSKGSV